MLNKKAKNEVGLQTDANGNLQEPKESVEILAKHFFKGSKPIEKADYGPWSDPTLIKEFAPNLVNDRVEEDKSSQDTSGQVSTS